MSDVGGIVNIARCPEHGLHGQRDTCFECGGPVEQVAMVKADMSDDAVIRADQTARSVLESEADFQESVRCVVMPCCGFTFDASHFDDYEGPARYTCPCCCPTVR